MVKNKRKVKQSKRQRIAIFVIIGIILAVFLFFKIAGVISYNNREDIAVIPIQGMISLSRPNMLFQGNVVNAEFIVQEIERASSASNIKGIIFDINSPGGTVVASKEVADAIAKVDKPTVALIRELGASGAYWAATSTDKIVANEYSMTGSIGVIGSYLQFSGLFEKYGITYEQMIAGELKDLGNPYSELSEEGRNILQNKLNKIHNGFLEEVAKNRGLESFNEIKSGEFYLGIEALELGLIDELGGKEEAVNAMVEMTGIESPNLIIYEERPGLLDRLSKLSASIGYSIGLGIGKNFGVSNDFSLIA